MIELKKASRYMSPKGRLYVKGKRYAAKELESIPDADKYLFGEVVGTDTPDKVDTPKASKETKNEKK